MCVAEAGGQPTAKSRMRVKRDDGGGVMRRLAASLLAKSCMREEQENGGGRMGDTCTVWSATVHVSPCT